MIISHKHKFIFLHTRKSAGTSIEISLSRYLGEDDIITPLAVEDEAIRRLLGKKPQNYMDEEGKSKKYYHHISAREVKEKVGDKIWNSYYKFCFERNPFEKAISWYFYHTKSQSMEGFDNWLKNHIYKDPIDFHKYTINDSIAVDFIGRYENLVNDLAQVCAEINIPFDGWLPRAKGFYRKNRLPYYDVLSAEQIRIISEINKNILNLFEDYQHHNSGKLKRVIYDKLEVQGQKEYYEKMANNLLKEGKIREALTASYMAIGLDFDNSWCYWYTAGNLFKEKSRYDEAIAAYQKSIELDPNFSWCWYNLGCCLEKKDRAKDAFQAYLKAASLYPNFTVFSDRLNDKSYYGAKS